jgi:hypothetical protein
MHDETGVVRSSLLHRFKYLLPNIAEKGRAEWLDDLFVALIAQHSLKNIFMPFSGPPKKRKAWAPKISPHKRKISLHQQASKRKRNPRGPLPEKPQALQ